MKYVWVVMAAFFFGLGAGLLLCNSTISHLRRRPARPPAEGNQGKKTETHEKGGLGYAWETGLRGYGAAMSSPTWDGSRSRKRCRRWP